MSKSPKQRRSPSAKRRTQVPIKQLIGQTLGDSLQFELTEDFNDATVERMVILGHVSDHRLGHWYACAAAVIDRYGKNHLFLFEVLLTHILGTTKDISILDLTGIEDLRIKVDRLRFICRNALRFKTEWIFKDEDPELMEKIIAQTLKGA